MGAGIIRLESQELGEAALTGGGVRWDFVVRRAARVGVALVLLYVLFLLSPWLLIASLLLSAGLLIGALLATPRDYKYWLLYVSTFTAFAGLRSLADQAGSVVRYHYVIGLDRLIGLGTVPSAVLQAHFRNPVFDMAAVALHLSWFVIPPLVPLLLWLTGRAFDRFAVAGAMLFAVSIATHVTLPTAPPWLASAHGLTQPVERILSSVLTPRAPTAMEAGYAASSNDVAAMPSLHMALTVLCALALADARKHWAVPMLVYSLLMGLEIVYMGEHYVTDAVVGTAYAWACWAAAARYSRESRTSDVSGQAAEPPHSREFRRKMRAVGPAG